MKKLKSILLMAVSVVLTTVLVGSKAVFADTDLMMAVSPPIHKIVLIPGETYHGTVDVSAAYNNTVDVKYFAEIAPFSLKKTSTNDGYENDFNLETDYNQIVNWITLENNEGSISPNETSKIHYTINVPENAPAGGQYAAITVRNGNDEENTVSESGATIVSIYQIASIILAQVAGETVETGSIKENNAPAFVFDGSNFKAESLIENTGNVHTDAEYTLQVWPLFSGEEICTNEENPETEIVMPGVEKYHAQSCNLPVFGIFNVKQTVKIFDQVSTVERMVIVCPMWLLFIIVLLVVLGILYLFAKAKKRKEN